MFEKEADKYGKENCVIQKNGLCTFVDSERTSKIWQDGATFGYNKATEWHYIKDQLPPEPLEENGSLKPLEYICAYKLNNMYDDFEIGEFLYVGNGEFMGENKDYPIYAWMDSPIVIPVPPKEIK